MAAVIGSMIYFIVQAYVLKLGFDPNDMKLLSAVLVALALAIPVMMARQRQKKSYVEGDLYAEQRIREEKSNPEKGGNEK